MTTPVPFAYGDHPIRTVTDLHGETWFVAADVCAVLGLANPHQVVGRLDGPDVSQADIRSGGQDRQMIIINESGLYDLVMRSDKPSARPFRRWVTSEVLPSIRKTGSYALTPQTWAQALRAAADEAEARELAEAKVAELEPAAAQFHQWQDSDATVLVVEWAKTLGLTQKAGFQALRELGVLFKQQHGAVTINVPKVGWTQYFVMIDYFVDPPGFWTKVPTVTAEGQVVLARLLTERGWVAPR